jgi:hypothetical protein
VGAGEGWWRDDTWTRGEHCPNPPLKLLQPTEQTEPKSKPKPKPKPIQVLSHEINHGFKLGMVPVEAFNGQPINNLAALAAAVDANKEPFLNFQLEGGRWATLDAAQVAAQGEEVLRVNSIPRDRSDDLIEAVQGKGEAVQGAAEEGKGRAAAAVEGDGGGGAAEAGGGGGGSS